MKAVTVALQRGHPDTTQLQTYGWLRLHLASYVNFTTVFLKALKKNQNDNEVFRVFASRQHILNIFSYPLQRLCISMYLRQGKQLVRHFYMKTYPNLYSLEFNPFQV